MQKSFLIYVLLCLLVKTEGIPQSIDDPALLSRVQWVEKRDPGAVTRLQARTCGKKRPGVLDSRYRVHAMSLIHHNTGQRIRFSYDIDHGIGIPCEYSTQKTSTTIKISFIPDLCIMRSGSLAATFVSIN